VVTPTPPPSLLTPRILWLALLMSQGIYLGILQMPGIVQPPTQPPDPTMLIALAGAALTTAVMSFLLPRILRRGAARGSNIETVETPGTAQSASYRAPLATARGFQDRDAALREGLKQGMSPFIVGLALTESIALFGFVLGFLGHPLFSYLPFFAVAWLLMLVRFPTENTFLGPLADAHGVTL
jgi:hypothetical protein